MSTAHTQVREQLAFNLANPGGTGNDALTDLVVYGKTPVLRLTVVPSTTSVVQINHTFGGQSYLYSVNDGTALTADQIYSFDIPAISGHTYNVQFVTSQTGNSAKVVLVALQQYEN